MCPSRVNPENLPRQTLRVYDAERFRVIDGVNMGEALGDASELILDDVYALTEDIVSNLMVRIPPEGPLIIGQATQTGKPGGDLHLDCVVTFMSQSGDTIEAVILVETTDDGDIRATYMLALDDVTNDSGYRIVGVDREGPRARLAQLASASFARDTHITMHNGQQRLVQDLAVGDRVLTRDEGPQTIRWIGESTQRATGAFAPIMIKQGVMNNENDLILSPDHHLFIYQRSDVMNVGRSEVLVRAADLVNGDTVLRLEGGFVDYFQILFDQHQILFAEGIAAESMLLDTRTTPAVTDTALPHHDGALTSDIDVLELDKDAIDTAERLRRASQGE